MVHMRTLSFYFVDFNPHHEECRTSRPADMSSWRASTCRQRRMSALCSRPVQYGSRSNLLQVGSSAGTFQYLIWLPKLYRCENLHTPEPIQSFITTSLRIGWTAQPGGATLRSGLGTTMVTAKFNFFVEAYLEFTFRVHSTSAHSQFKFFVDGAEKLNINSSCQLSWYSFTPPPFYPWLNHYRNTFVAAVDHGTHVFKWEFTGGTETTPMYVLLLTSRRLTYAIAYRARGNSAEIAGVRVWGTDYAQTDCQPCPVGSAAQQFRSSQCLRCPVNRYAPREQSSTCLSCSPDRYSLSGRACKVRPNCT